MTITQVYEFFDCNWCKAMRELNLGVNTYKYWRKVNYIPMPTQLKIEKATNGALLADINL